MCPVWESPLSYKNIRISNLLYGISDSNSHSVLAIYNISEGRKIKIHVQILYKTCKVERASIPTHCEGRVFTHSNPALSCKWLWVKAIVSVISITTKNSDIKTVSFCRTQSQALHDLLQSQGSNSTHITYPEVSHADFAIGWKVAFLCNLSFLDTLFCLWLDHPAQ